MSTFTLGELLEIGPLALEPLTGGPDAPARRVAGAHSIELERPSTWLGSDWVMLTAGTRLRGNERAQRELVAELDDAGVSALGLGMDLVFKRPPRALVSEAERRDFPVFSVPLRTPFREIVTEINRALLSDEMRSYQRLSSMQLYLIDALREADPRATLVGRLSELLDAAVAVLSPTGRQELAVGEIPADVWPALAERPVALHELGRTVATPVLDEAGRLEAWLVAVTRRANGLVKPVTQAAAPLLAATGRLQRTERAQLRAIGAALLDELLSGTGDARELAARAAGLGIDFRLPARVVTARGVNLEEALAALGVPYLTSGGMALVQGAERERLAAALATAEAAGIGRPVSTVPAVADSLRDARLAVGRVERDGRPGVLAFEDFELGLLLLSEAPRGRIAPKVERWIGELREQPMLWAAVVAYFEHDLDVGRAAQALHLHPNSLRYRLTRVEKLLGRPLKQPSTIASLYVAMLAD